MAREVTSLTYMSGRPSTSGRVHARGPCPLQSRCHPFCFRIGTEKGIRRKESKYICTAVGTNTVTASESADLETAEPSTSGSLIPKQGRIAVFQASKSATQSVQPGVRPLAEYMALPASQYSVLDAKKIERLDDNTFRCHVGGLHFFNFIVEPVLTVSVVVGERGPTVKLLETKLEGSPSVEAANDKFGATMTNVVQWDTSADGGLELRSDTDIQVSLEVPSWFRIIPLPALEGTGSRVMQGVLNTMVPRFLKQLSLDYHLWASGDNSRKPIGTGEL
eukprot:jgi/Botrbrau1/4411/Bobra.0348s0004.1